MAENAGAAPQFAGRPVGYGVRMSQITDSVSTLAQDLGETVASLAQDVAAKAQDAASAAGELGIGLVETGRKRLQDAGVVAKPKRSKLPFLTILIIIVGGLVAFKLLKGRGGSSSTPSYPETDRLADSTGISVG
jgi:hypothetical protein